MPDIKTNLVNKTKSSSAFLVAAAKAVPADKADFNVGGMARNTLSIVTECAGFPDFVIAAVQTEAMPPMDAPSPTYETLDEALVALQEATDRLCAFIPTVSEEKLDRTITFPWETTDVASVLGYHYWNNTYHLGQVNQIQLALGDTEMHMP